ASVVIFDDFVTGKSEIRYFLKDLKGKERRLYFANGTPREFMTGRKFKVRGRGRPDAGLDVEGLTAMADGDATGGDTAGAPVAAAETRTVLTLLVDFNDALVDNGSNNGISLQEAKDRMFNETKNVAHFFNTASLGTWTIPDDTDGDGNQEVYGPYKIDYDYMNSTCSYTSWVSAARAAFEAATGRSHTDYRHTLLIVPNYWDYPASAGRSCSWGGIAQLGCGSTCWAIGADAKSIFHGVIIHELGHNFTMHHAGTDPNNDGTIDSEYGDSSDNMGGSRIWAKFNAVHAEEMGWHDPVNYEVQTLVPSSGTLYEFDLLAMDEDVPEWPGLRAIKVQRDANSDYYLSYRLAEGHYNNIPSTHRNKLHIHYGKGTNRSYFVTSLSPGQTYNDPHNGLIFTAVSETSVDATQVMTVQICQDTCSPFPAPSNLTATASGTSAIDLAWTNNAGPVDGFTLQHSTDGSNWSEEYQGPDTSYSDTGLAVASTHYYRVRAFLGSDVSGWSNVASATTEAVPPTAGFTWSNVYTEAAFTDTSTDDTSITSWYWTFGDGNTSSQQNPAHTYAETGTFNVSLTVTDEHGASDSFSDSVTVDEPPFTEHFAHSEVTTGGTLSGSLSDTHADDGVAQSV
ncbi:MAG: PKD domain-containing protein, partial [Thiohalobacterales bacterium]|nr:PKD domain-containing protein [Thiohalobacterales bacterium]